MVELILSKDHNSNIISKSYIFGMAKSTQGNNSRNLELDFVRLLLAVRTIQKNGSNSVGILCLADRYYNTVYNWMNKYNSWNEIAVYTPDLSEKEKKDLRDEKDANSKFEKNVADYGRDLFEGYLTRLIDKYFCNYEKIEETDALFNIQWDECLHLKDDPNFIEKASKMIIELNTELIEQSISKAKLQEMAISENIIGCKKMEKVDLLKLKCIKTRISKIFSEN